MLVLSSLLKDYAPQPHFVIPNPVFEQELRHVPGPRSIDDLKRYGLIMLLGFHLLIGVVWLAARAIYGNMPVPASTVIYAVVAFGTIALSVSADLYAALATVSRVRHYIDSGKWDLLRLTAVPAENIVAAEYAVAQVRVWRIMLSETIFRITGLVFLALFNPNTTLMLFIALPVSLYLIVLVAAFLIEPKARIQAVIAFSLAIGVLIGQQSFGLLAALGMVLSLRAAQLAVLGSLWYIAFRLLNTPTSLFCILPVACLGAICLFYAVYRALERQSLRQALRFAM